MRYVQLQALRNSLEILFASLEEVLLSMNYQDRERFVKSLLGQIQESLRTSASDYSGHAGLLIAMCQKLLDDLHSSEETSHG